MKKLHFLLSMLMVLVFYNSTSAQLISESAKKKVTVGVDIFTDIWQNLPSDISTRTINQGANVFIMYNKQLGKSKTAFAFGFGFSNHNMFGPFTIEDIRSDTIVFVPIPSNVNYRNSKMALTSIDIPLEFKLKLDNGVKFGLGFKMGWVISSKTKYRGDVDGVERRVKELGINQLENFVYGGTFRVGYKIVNLFANYQISKVFQKGKGPQLYPISVGLTITPF